MKPLLSICVPTYNRPVELAERLKEFLEPMAKGFPGEVEIIVRDNSDSAEAEINRENCSRLTRYSKNEVNIGYHGNLGRLLAEAEGHYVWIVSDNDRLLLENGEALLAALRRALEAGIAAITIDYLIEDELGCMQRERGLGGMWNNPCYLYALDQWRQARLPFTLLSSAIVRNDRKAFREAQAALAGNDFIQIGLFITAIGRDGWVVASGIPMVQYSPELNGRFSVKSLFQSHRAVAEYCRKRIGVDARLSEAEDWLLFLIHHRAGFMLVKDAEVDTGWFISRMDAPTTWNVRIKLALLQSPRFILRQLYPFYRAKVTRNPLMNYLERVSNIRSRQKLIAEAQEQKDAAVRAK